jgi:hypothetical protein
VALRWGMVSWGDVAVWYREVLLCPVVVRLSTVLSRGGMVRCGAVWLGIVA